MFLERMDTTVHCPECGCELTSSLHFEKGEPYWLYPHPAGMVIINGYPGLCVNSEKNLTQMEITVNQTPVYSKGRPGVYG